MSIVLWIVGVLLVIVGIAGIIFPALPGHVLIFAGLLIAAWADNFTRVSGWTLALIGVIGLLLDMAMRKLETLRSLRWGYGGD